MTPGLFGLAVLAFCAGGADAIDLHEIEPRRPHDFDSSERTFLFGKLVLVPVLAAIGLKFLALLPIVLSKIAVLSVMNFLSTNLNLIVSTLFGMKNFLGKHGLWAQEDTTRHPDLETFAEFANQPLLQPSFRYQYVMDRDPFLGKTEAIKMPLKGFHGFIPTDSNYKVTVDRRTRANDRKQLPIAKELRNDGGAGKYKCYWTNGAGDSAVKLDYQEPFVNRRKFDIADKPKTKPGNYNEFLYNFKDIYAETTSAAGAGHGLPMDAEAYRRSVSGAEVPAYRQVATHGSAAETEDGSGIRDGGLSLGTK